MMSERPDTLQVLKRPATPAIAPRECLVDSRLVRILGIGVAFFGLFLASGIASVVVMLPWLSTPPGAGVVAIVLVGLLVGLMEWGILAWVYVSARRRVWLEVDPKGITRHGLFRTFCWPWAAFADGRVEQTWETEFRFGELPFGSRSLRLTALAEDDLVFLYDAVRRHLALARRPAPPDHLAIRVTEGLFRPRKSCWQFDAEGIRRGGEQEPNMYTWAEVRRLSLKRLAETDQGFIAITLDLPNESISLVSPPPMVFWRRKNFTGAPPSVIVAFLRTHVPSRHVRFVELFGPTANEAALERRLRIARCVQGVGLSLSGVLLWVVAALERDIGSMIQERLLPAATPSSQLAQPFLCTGAFMSFLLLVMAVLACWAFPVGLVIYFRKQRRLSQLKPLVCGEQCDGAPAS